MKFLDVRRQYLEWKDEFDEAYNRVMNSGTYVLGDEVDAFEQEWAKYCGTRYCIGVSSGADALYLAMLAARISNHAVIVPTNTYIATWNAVTQAGGLPVPLEPDGETYNIAPKLKGKLPKEIKAICPVHLYGIPCNMDMIVNFAKAHGIYVISDCAQAHGAAWNGKNVGAFEGLNCWCLPSNTKLVRNDGMRIPISEIKIGDRILSLDQESLKLDWVDVEAKRKSLIEKEILRITCETGHSIETSRLHNILVIRDSKFQWIKAEDVEVGDSILHYHHVPKETLGTTIEGSIDLFYLAGLIASDGSIAQKDRITFSNRNLTLRNIFRALCIKLFDKEPSEFYKKNDMAYLCGQKIRNLMARIEKNIEAQNDLEIISYLQGYGDGDGCIYLTSRNRPAINIATLGEGEADHIRYLLLRLGIRSQFSFHKPGIRIFPNGKKSKTKGGKCVIITDQKSIEKYIDVVGFRHPKKYQKCIDWKNKINSSNIKRDNLDLIPIGNLLKSARIIAKKPSYKINNLSRGSVSQVERGLRRLRRDLVHSVGEELNSIEMLKFAESDVYFWRITNIEKVPNFDSLYDISVSKNNCFFADGIVVHNSFYPAKNLGAFGDAGAITTNDGYSANLIRKMRNHGSMIKYEHDVFGINARLDPLQAAFLRIKLKHLDWMNSRRREIARIYYDRLSDVPDLKLPFIPKAASPVWHQFVVRHPRRDELRKMLEVWGVPTLMHYPTPPHMSGAYKYLRIQAGRFPKAEGYAGTILSLPIDPFMSYSDVEQVIQAVKDFG